MYRFLLFYVALRHAFSVNDMFNVDWNMYAPNSNIGWNYSVF